MNRILLLLSIFFASNVFTLVKGQEDVTIGIRGELSVSDCIQHPIPQCRMFQNLQQVVEGESPYTANTDTLGGASPQAIITLRKNHDYVSPSADNLENLPNQISVLFLPTEVDVTEYLGRFVDVAFLSKETLNALNESASTIYRPSRCWESYCIIGPIGPSGPKFIQWVDDLVEGEF